MSSGSKIPWPKINDFLMEIASTGNPDEFAGLTLQNIGRLVPFDHNGLFVTVGVSGEIEPLRSVVECKEWVRLFNSDFRRFMPNVQRTTFITEDYDWGRFRKNPFINDFLKPQGIRYSIAVFHAGNPPGRTVSFTLLRSKGSRPFTETEQIICRIIQPHFGILFNLISKVNQRVHQIYHPAELVRDCKLLSKREAEVAALLCQRLTRPEIATRLLLSPRTVEFHIRNIYNKLKVGNRRELLAKLLK